MGLHTPAGRGGLCAGDVLMEVGGTSVIFLTHSQVRSQYKHHQSKGTRTRWPLCRRCPRGGRRNFSHLPHSISGKTHYKCHQSWDKVASAQEIPSWRPKELQSSSSPTLIRSQYKHHQSTDTSRTRWPLCSRCPHGGQRNFSHLPQSLSGKITVQMPPIHEHQQDKVASAHEMSSWRSEKLRSSSSLTLR